MTNPINWDFETAESKRALDKVWTERLKYANLARGSMSPEMVAMMARMLKVLEEGFKKKMPDTVVWDSL